MRKRGWGGWGKEEEEEEGKRRRRRRRKKKKGSKTPIYNSKEHSTQEEQKGKLKAKVTLVIIVYGSMPMVWQSLKLNLCSISQRTIMINHKFLYTICHWAAIDFHCTTRVLTRVWITLGENLANVSWPKNYPSVAEKFTLVACIGVCVRM